MLMLELKDLINKNIFVKNISANVKNNFFIFPKEVEGSHICMHKRSYTKLLCLKRFIPFC